MKILWLKFLSHWEYVLLAVGWVIAVFVIAVLYFSDRHVQEKQEIKELRQLYNSLHSQFYSVQAELERIQTKWRKFNTLRDEDKRIERIVEEVMRKHGK